MRKGQITSEETKKKIGDANRGRVLTDEHKEKLRQAKLKKPTRYWFGKKRNDDTKRKISETKMNSVNTPRKEKHHNWNGGASRGYKQGYRKNLLYRQWRTFVFERDNYTCQECGKRGGVYITAHHIKSWAKYPEFRYDVDNGTTLCEECHKLTDNYAGRGIKKEKIFL